MLMWSPATGANRIHRAYSVFQRMFRPGRLAHMYEMASVTEETSIVDSGGAVGFWQYAPFTPAVTIVNLDTRLVRQAQEHGMKAVVGDACRMPFGDKEFDLAVSNSVIEHIPPDSRQAYSDELMRVADGVWLQTPARVFPVEPHFMALGVHWLPVRLRYVCVRWFSLWAWLAKPQPDEVWRAIQDTRLLARRDLEALFPGCRIDCERVLGIPKSYIVSKTHARNCKGALARSSDSAPGS